MAARARQARQRQRHFSFGSAPVSWYAGERIVRIRLKSGEDVALGVLEGDEMTDAGNGRLREHDVASLAHDPFGDLIGRFHIDRRNDGLSGLIALADPGPRSGSIGRSNQPVWRRACQLGDCPPEDAIVEAGRTFWIVGGEIDVDETRH